MSTDTYLTTSLPGETASAVATNIAMAHFQSAIDNCVNGWQRGEETVVIDYNMHALFGDLLFQYFERSLNELVKAPVAFTFIDVNDSVHTIVTIPKIKNAQDSSAPKTTVEVPHVKSSERAVTVVAKKAPRPMNCWIIFRDAMHKKLKFEQPELTVQQISSRCSDLWRGLSATEKEPWQAAAKSAKEEHLRQHPDYKYSPRKPGEKKKRQSRKAKRAAASAIGIDVFNLEMTPETGMLSQMQLPQFDFDFTTPATTTLGNMVESYTDGTAYFNDPADLMGVIPQEFSVGYAHDAETLRHARLADEFEVEFDSTLQLDVDGDFLGFRDGADGNATLPAFSHDLF
ncbi:hypothetical protein NX059_005281 [Plenodomus lindquistii]|nr:hypothetical protein NX059_005281 [Plenodomus lindquistii]